MATPRFQPSPSSIGADISLPTSFLYSVLRLFNLVEVRVQIPPADLFLTSRRVIAGLQYRILTDSKSTKKGFSRQAYTAARLETVSRSHWMAERPSYIRLSNDLLRERVDLPLPRGVDLGFGIPKLNSPSSASVFGW